MKSKVKSAFTSVRLHQLPAVILLLAGCLLNANAQPAAELFAQANQLYKANEYRQAAADYEQLISQGYHTAEVFYNLGNCYYKIDSTGACILNFERALKLSPKDEDIIHNLKLAQLKAIDNQQPVPQLAIITWWNNFITFRNSQGWGLLALLLVWASFLVFAVALLMGRKKILNAMGLLLLLASGSALALAFHQRSWEQSSQMAILMASTSFVKSAPDANASDLFMLHEGARLEILDQVGEWNKIRLEDGKVGWIEKESFEKI